MKSERLQFSFVIGIANSKKKVLTFSVKDSIEPNKKLYTDENAQIFLYYNYRSFRL